MELGGSCAMLVLSLVRRRRMDLGESGLATRCFTKHISGDLGSRLMHIVHSDDCGNRGAEGLRLVLSSCAPHHPAQLNVEIRWP